MLTFPQIDPLLLSMGPISIRWYGVMYLIGFFSCYYLCKKRLALYPRLSEQNLGDLLFYIALGVIIGGRLGYLVYEPSMLFHEPLNVLKFWLPGRAFHGGLLGTLVAVYLFARKTNNRFLDMTDFIAPTIPLALGFGRLGNFINGELWGRVTTMPWAMVFPHADAYPRHPSQLYEVLLEGVLLFILLMLYSKKPRPTGALSGVFLIGYGGLRIFVECFREPDLQLGYLFTQITMGQLLSLPMLAFGIWLQVRSYRHPH